jgi:hypothetical protein
VSAPQRRSHSNYLNTGLGSDSELNMTQERGTTIVGNSQEGHVQITMVASRQDSTAEVTSAEVTSTKSPLPTHPAVYTPPVSLAPSVIEVTVAILRVSTLHNVDVRVLSDSTTSIEFGEIL